MLQNNYPMLYNFFSQTKILHLSLILLISSLATAGQLIDLGTVENFNKIFQFSTPFSINNYTKIRLGNLNDAGYIVPLELLDTIEKCYTYGAGNDVSFELNLNSLKPSIITYIYDHTSNFPHQIEKNIFFKKEGIASIQSDQLNTFENHMQENADENAQILLKIDIEGAEWDVLKNISKNFFENIPLLIVEFHSFSELKNLPLYTEVLEKINTYFTAFHIHGNNCGNFIRINQKNYADVIEITFINKKYITSQVIQNKPIIDTTTTTNCPGVASFILDFWL